MAIVGGGVSGLASAYFLARKGIRSVLIEKSSRLGGLIQTDVVHGCELEAGPDSFLATKTSVAEVTRQLGIESQLIDSNDERRRIFIVRHGRLVPMPAGMVMMVPGDLPAVMQSDFFSAEAKLRFETELSFEPRVRNADVSIREFVNDHFGPESLQYVTEPLLSGVYGGDAGELSTQSVLPRFLEYERTYGSLVRAVQQERSLETAPKGSLFRSFRGGMQTLTDALAKAAAPYVTMVSAEACETVRSGAGWSVRLDSGEVVNARQLILACPAHVSACLLRSAEPALSDQLAAIPYSSAILVSLVYSREEFDYQLDGFGFLVPRPERRSVAAATWVSTKFPERTPPELVALRAFIVGQDAIELMNASDPDLTRIAREEFKRLMDVGVTPKFEAVYRWPKSMPQYVVGHQARQEGIRQFLHQSPGLHLCGNAYNGVGIPDCIQLASDVAETIQS